MDDLTEMLWPGKGDSKAEWLGIQASWSIPIFQAVSDQRRREALDQKLESLLRQHMAQAIEGEFGRANALEWQVVTEQIGTSAEVCHAALAWIESIPHEVLVGIIAEGANRALSRLAGYVRNKLNAVHVSIPEGELTVNLRFDPSLLVLLCEYDVMKSYGVERVEQAEWRELTAQETEARGRAGLRPDQYVITISALGRRFSYIVDSHGVVHEYLINNISAPAPRLIPDVSPTPVNVPVTEDPTSGKRIAEWPSQDRVDRSRQLAVIAMLTADFGNPVENWEFVDFARELTPQVRLRLEDAATEALNSVLPDEHGRRVHAVHYQVGPAAGGIAGLEHYIATLFESRDALPPIIGNLSEAWVIVEIVSMIVNRLKAWVRSYDDSRLDVSLSFPPEVLKLLCQEYVRKSFHPRARLRSEWFCLTSSFYGGYRSPAHPSEGMEYLIIVRTSKAIYRFRVRGTGEVVTLFVKHGRLEAELVSPHLFAA